MKIKVRQRSVSSELLDETKRIMNSLIIDDGKVIIMDDLTSHFDAHNRENNFEELSIIKMDRSVDKVEIQVFDPDDRNEFEFIKIDNNELGLVSFHTFNFAQMFIDGNAIVFVTERSDR